MLWYIISAAAAGISLFVIVLILVKKIPELRILDIESLPQTRTEKIKSGLLESRLLRLKSEKMAKLFVWLKPLTEAVSKIKISATQKIKQMEKVYQDLSRQSR